MEGKFNFKKAAQAQVSLSPIMVGREKLSTEDIKGKDLTIIGFDFAPKFDKDGTPIIGDDGTPDTFGVLIFEEYPSAYYSVGTVFTKVCHAWMSGFDTPEEASKELAEQGGVKVRFTETKTKKGNNLTAVEIL